MTKISVETGRNTPPQPQMQSVFWGMSRRGERPHTRLSSLTARCLTSATKSKSGRRQGMGKVVGTRLQLHSALKRKCSPLQQLSESFLSLFFSLQHWLMTWEVVQYKSLVLLFCSALEKHTDLECGVGLRRGQKAWDPPHPPPHSTVRWPGHPVCQPGRNSCLPPLVLRTDTTKELFVMFSFMDYMHKWVLSIEQAATLFFSHFVLFYFPLYN